MVGKEHLPLKGLAAVGARDEGYFMTEEAVKKVGYTEVFARNRASKAKVVVNVGGAGSSKSHSIAQLFIERLLTEQNKVFGVCRHTFPALRMTAMGLVLGLLKEYGVYDEDKHNKTANNYTYGSNIIWFFSLDEVEKIKSTNFSYVWIEEANELDWESFIVLKLRLRAPIGRGEVNQIFLSLNPSDATGWIALRLCGAGELPPDPEVEVIHSTYLDNPFLDADYIKVLENLISQDENFYNVYTLGRWGRLEGKIYSNYKVIPELPVMEKCYWAYGLDFGYSSISTLVKVVLFNNKIFAEEHLYKTGMTVADIIEFLSHELRGDIYGDPSSKQAIKEIMQAGYTAFEGIKSVKESIDLCKQQTIFIPQSSTNLIKEIQSYHWKKNPQASGQADAFLPEPVKYNDHAMDAMRYAVWGVVTRFGFPTAALRPTEPIHSLSFSGQNRSKILERWLKHGT